MAGARHASTGLRQAQHRAGRTRRRGWSVLVMTALAASLGFGASVYALGRAEASFGAPPVIVAGDLGLTDAGVSWIETTPGLDPSARRGGNNLASLADFPAMPGDQLTISQQVQSTLVGQNLRGRLTVRLDTSAANNPNAPAATWCLLDQSGQPGASQPLDQPVSVDIAGPGVSHWTILITLTIPDRPVFSYDTGASAGSRSGDGIGPILVTLEQQRAEA